MGHVTVFCPRWGTCTYIFPRAGKVGSSLISNDITLRKCDNYSYTTSINDHEAFLGPTPHKNNVSVLQRLVIQV